MRTEQLDVELVVQRAEVISEGGFEKMLPKLLRQMKYTADSRAAEVGGEVRATVAPEIVISEAISPLLGEVFAMATRWVVDVPENAVTTPER